MRVSTLKQTLESQFQDLFDFASKYYNLKKEDIIPIEYKESGRNLTEEERLGIIEFKKKCEEGEDIKAVFIWETSRLSRKRIVTDSFVDYLQNHHIQLICQNPLFELFNPETWEKNPSSDIVLNIFISLAEQESIEKSLRFKRGKKYLASQGRYNGGAIPYGYKIDKEQENRIVPDEGGEADVVREIFNLYENGYSQPKIAKELYRRGQEGRAVKKANNKFTISLVHQILTNELLTGVPHKSKGASYERQYPMIITPEQFERCRKIAKANNTVAPKSLRVYYAHRLIKCTECGRYFVSTGYKNYYHCWDAYYSYRDINGYEGVPKCTNRICISTNIMDSLLWQIAKEYETTFILNSAQSKLDECRKAKAILEEKISSLPALRKVLDTRMDNLYDALSEGMKKEKFKVKKNKLLLEYKALDADEAQYKEQLIHYDSLEKEIIEKIDKPSDSSNEDAVDRYVEGYLDKIDAVMERVSSITSDEERSKIIHRHIEKVTVEATTIPYKFASHTEEIEAAAKRITVYSYMSGPREFFFIPNNGKGGIMLFQAWNDDTKAYYGRDVLGPQYAEFPMEYLPRLIDTGKKKRREIERAKREGIISQGTKRLREEGYISMNDMREMSKLSYSTLHKAIKAGKMRATNMYKTWYVPLDDFLTYLHTDNPKPRPRRQTTYVYDENRINDAGLERLMKALYEYMEEEDDD